VSRRAALGLAVVAALAAAAIARPPRATPAFSYATTIPTPYSSVIPGAGPRSEPKSRDGRNHRRSRRRLHARGADGRRRRTPPHRLDLNRAGAAALARVPGVSEELARRIVAFRELVGPFESLEDLGDLDGISPGRLETLGRYVVVK
jgi:competence protein ComEA